MKTSTIILIIIWMFLFIYLAKTQITIKPFSVKMPSWRNAVGYTLLVASIVLIKYDSYLKGKLDGVNYIIEKINETK